VVLVEARVDKRDDLPKLIISSVDLLDISGMAEVQPLRLRLPARPLDDRSLSKLHEAVCSHPGNSPVFIHLAQQVLRLPDQFCVDTSNGLVGELRELFGEDCVQV
jgi:hypothetical protein